MTSRQVSFFVESVELPQVLSAVENRLVPRYAAHPHFPGLTAIKSDHGAPAEVIVTSFRDDGIEGSEREATRFVKEILEVTGHNPSRKAYDTLYAQVRDSQGLFHLGPVRQTPAE